MRDLEIGKLGTRSARRIDTANRACHADRRHQNGYAYLSARAHGHEQKQTRHRLPKGDTPHEYLLPHRGPTMRALRPPPERRAERGKGDDRSGVLLFMQ